MASFFPVLGFLIVNSIYLIGKFITSILLGVHDTRVFIGYGTKQLFKLKLKKLELHVGWFIPLPWLAKFYKYDEFVKEPISYEWQLTKHSILTRLLTIYSGAIFSFLMAMVIFTGVNYMTPRTILSIEEFNKYGVYPSQDGMTWFEEGDKILQVNGSVLKEYRDIFIQESDRDSIRLTVERDDTLIDIFIPANQLKPDSLFTINAPFTIDSIVSSSFAYFAKLKKRDQIIKVDNKPVKSLASFKDEISQSKSNYVWLTVLRQGEEIILECQKDQDNILGFTSRIGLEYDQERLSLLQSIKSGATYPFEVFYVNSKAFVSLFIGEVKTKNRLGGSIGLAKLWSSNDSWSHFLRITGFLLCLILYYEILPIPGLGLNRSIPLISEAIGRPMNRKGYFKTKKYFWWSLFLLFVVSVVKDLSSLI
ncbi:site-2 protease family protein [Reichenbachiella versicolor]|uniref:site-2 protease family protein n=1 Tax=Reichenbachiella versicolor TaxID=1821036 RepID=UPI000D6E6701|nr:site-2 protease family protein [Reichenbachiella versicolor]